MTGILQQKNSAALDFIKKSGIFNCEMSILKKNILSVMYLACFIYVGISAQASTVDVEQAKIETLSRGRIPFSVDYFATEPIHERDLILSTLSESQISVLDGIKNANELINTKSLLESQFIYIGEYKKGDIHAVYYGIPDELRIAYIEATISTCNSYTAISYRGYQEVPSKKGERFCLWGNGWLGCRYEGFDSDLPLFVATQDINDVRKTLSAYWLSKGYEYIGCVQHEGNVIFRYRQYFNWGHCIRIIFENNMVKCVQIGKKCDSLPVNNI